MKYYLIPLLVLVLVNTICYLLNQRLLRLQTNAVLTLITFAITQNIKNKIIK